MNKLIDKEYKRQLNQLHQEGLFNNGKASYGIVKRFIKRFAPKSILDFGCGHGALMGVIKYNHPHIIIDGYDPGNPKFQIFPKNKYDAVISIDVFEHIEPKHLDTTLAEIGKKIGKYAFFRIACYPARKKLPDGRNAHLIIKRPVWWRKKIIKAMDVDIFREKIIEIDKGMGIKGQNYDLIVRSRYFNDTNYFRIFINKYFYRKI